MARPGVTYSEVSHEAQRLVAAGKAPTIEAIRIALGTGSNSTLGAHLRTWKTRQGQTQEIASKEHIPEALVATLKGLWEQVMDEAEGKIQAIHQETQQDTTKLTQELQHFQQNSVHWQQQHQQIKQERDAFAHDKATLEQLLNNAKIEMAALSEKYAAIEKQAQEKQLRAEELRQQNQQMQANLEHYRAASLEQRVVDQQRHEQQQKQLEQTISQTNQELAQIKQENLILQQQNQETNFERNTLKSQLDKLNGQHQLATERLADALNELAKKSQAQQHWQEQHDIISTKWDEQNKSFIELQTQHTLSKQELTTIKDELKEINAQNKALSHEKWILGQEKSQLYGQLKQLQEIHGLKESYS